MKTAITAALLMSMVFPQAASSHEFTAINGFLAYLKLIDPTNIAPYVTIFEARFAPKPVGNQNEFSRIVTEGDAAKILNKNLSTFDLGEPFSISVSSNVGEYDFDKHEFDFRPISAATSFKSGSSSWSEPGDIQVVFLNTKDFHGLPFETKAAESFVKKNGRIVYVDVEFTPASALEGSNKIRANLSKIDVYADAQRSNLIHTMKINGR